MIHIQELAVQIDQVSKQLIECRQRRRGTKKDITDLLQRKEKNNLKLQINTLNQENEKSKIEFSQQYNNYNNLSEELKKEKDENAKLIEEKNNIEQKHKLLENHLNR